MADYFATAIIAFVGGFAVGALVFRQRIIKYGIAKTHYEKTLAEYKKTLLREETKPRPQKGNE